MEISKALLDTLLAGAANLHPQMPVRPFPRPARRARAVFAAPGRFHHTAITEVHSKRPLQPLPLLRSPRWRLMEVTPQYVYQPHLPGSHPPQPPPSRLSAPMRAARTARTHNLQPTALWGRLPRRLQVRPHRSSRPRSSLRRRSGCCLPTAAPAPRKRTRTLDPAFDPAADKAGKAKGKPAAKKVGK